MWAVRLGTISMGMGGYSIIIRLEARLRPNIGFSLLGDSAVFTGSAQTLPKVNRFG